MTTEGLTDVTDVTDVTDEIGMTTEILTEEKMTTAGPEGSTESATDPYREPLVTGLHDWSADIRALEGKNFLRASERDLLQAAKAELSSELTAAVTSAEARITNLVAERDSAQAALANLATERDSLERRVSQLDTEYDAFKEQVVEVASRYAEDNDWCSVIDNALTELGLERKTTVYEGVITITIAFHAELNRGKTGLPSQRWVRDSLSLSSIRGAIEDSLEFDADHESSEVDSVEFAVSGLELRSYGDQSGHAAADDAAAGAAGVDQGDRLGRDDAAGVPADRRADDGLRLRLVRAAGRDRPDGDRTAVGAVAGGVRNALLRSGPRPDRRGQPGAVLDEFRAQCLLSGTRDVLRHLIFRGRCCRISVIAWYRSHGRNGCEHRRTSDM